LSGLADPGPGRAIALEPLEAAAGLGIGSEPRPFYAVTPSREDPLEALIAVMAGHLRAGPTYVSFSGGRDSSAILAVATLAARRHGLPEPVPITLRFAGVASTEESDWQELVINHLGLGRWEVIELGDELDLLGDLACDALRAHGHLYPPNAYFHVPMLERAGTGRLLTGYDGDGLFGYWRWERAQSILSGRRRPTARDLPRVGLALAPAAVRRRTMPAPLLARVAPWLRAAALRDWQDRARAAVAAEPRRWDRRVAFYGHDLVLALSTHSLRLLGAARGIEVAFPFLDSRFASALAAAGGAGGFGDRSGVMRAVFAPALPLDVLVRRGKAEFGRALWHERARAFAREWDGSGVDPALVDADVLRADWAQENPRFTASTLLHGAWLASQPH
jgi:asparagine synthase (glutamine-hydrolysing)